MKDDMEKLLTCICSAGWAWWAWWTNYAAITWWTPWALRALWARWTNKHGAGCRPRGRHGAGCRPRGRHGAGCWDWSRAGSRARCRARSCTKLPTLLHHRIIGRPAYLTSRSNLIKIGG